MTARRLVTVVLTLGGLIGVVVRYPMLFYIGTDDMNYFYAWGRQALESGLADSYNGYYFPLQVQVFELCAWIVARWGLDFVLVFKLANLVFDLGSFCLLVLLLKRQGSNPAYALLYWLHPWFLSIFSLGYVDAQLTFFVLLSVYLLSRDTTAHYILAGIPLALAFLMKPQAQILVIASFLYGAFHYARTRNPRPLGMIVFPIVLFLAYEAYFTISLFSNLGYRAAWVLPSSYSNVTNVLPALTAQMLNLWYPVAYVMKQPPDPIFAISDQIHVLPYISAKFVAAGAALGLIGTHIFRVERERETSISDTFARIFGFASIAVPFLMTSAHENHLFLGSAFLVLFVASPMPGSLMAATQILLIVQFLNIYGLYGEHPRWVAQFLRNLYAPEQTGYFYSLISIVCFVAILRSIWTYRGALGPSLFDAAGRSEDRPLLVGLAPR